MGTIRAATWSPTSRQRSKVDSTSKEVNNHGQAKEFVRRLGVTEQCIRLRFGLGRLAFLGLWARKQGLRQPDAAFELGDDVFEGEGSSGWASACPPAWLRALYEPPWGKPVDNRLSPRGKRLQKGGVPSPRRFMLRRAGQSTLYASSTPLDLSAICCSTF